MIMLLIIISSTYNGAPASPDRSLSVTSRLTNTVALVFGRKGTVVTRLFTTAAASAGAGLIACLGLNVSCHIIDHEDNEMMRPYKVQK
jgi:hypothetical protein